MAVSTSVANQPAVSVAPQTPAPKPAVTLSAAAKARVAAKAASVAAVANWPTGLKTLASDLITREVYGFEGVQLSAGIPGKIMFMDAAVAALPPIRRNPANINAWWDSLRVFVASSPSLPADANAAVNTFAHTLAKLFLSCDFSPTAPGVANLNITPSIKFVQTRICQLADSLIGQPQFAEVAATAKGLVTIAQNLKASPSQIIAPLSQAAEAALVPPPPAPPVAPEDEEAAPVSVPALPPVETKGGINTLYVLGGLAVVVFLLASRR